MACFKGLHYCDNKEENGGGGEMKSEEAGWGEMEFIHLLYCGKR